MQWEEGWGRFVWEVELSSPWYMKVRSGFLGAAMIIAVRTLTHYFIPNNAPFRVIYSNKMSTLNTTVNSKVLKTRFLALYSVSSDACFQYAIQLFPHKDTVCNQACL